MAEKLVSPSIPEFLMRRSAPPRAVPRPCRCPPGPGTDRQGPARGARHPERDDLDQHLRRRGGTTLLAQKLAARFRTAGVPEADIQLLGAEAKDQNLVVRIRGKGTAKPVLVPGASRRGRCDANRLVDGTLAS